MEWHRGRQAVSDILRALLSACLMMSAVVHLFLWTDWAKSNDVVGPAFLLNAAAGIVLGVLVLVWRHWLPLLGAIGFGVATMGAFLISTTPGGFFQVHERWVGVPGVAGGDLRDRRDRARHRRDRRRASARDQ